MERKKRRCGRKEGKGAGEQEGWRSRGGEMEEGRIGGVMWREGK